ncbi:MAG: hypothetical protein WCT14_04770 [Treponemataceae bacterium]
MTSKIKDTEVYAKVVDAFKRRREGATPVDIVSMTGLPIERVKEYIPVASDEFGARLRVTESGEILYSFPDGFKSRYKGFGPTMRRFWSAFKKGAAVVAKALFKVWIMVMLVGYFVLFMAIAIVALVASVAVSASGSSNDRDDRRGGNLGGLMIASHVFNLIIRIWFYSELVKSIDDPYGNRRRAAPKKRPLYSAVFSFVFGDGDPNAGWDTRERKAVVSYIQANRGVIALPEFMAITGLTPTEAEEAITSYLVEFGGSPEATNEGTVVYRFDELLLKSDTRESIFEFSAPLKKVKNFSENPKKLNRWFIALNSVNLLFGSYFLYNAITVGQITQQAQITGGTYLYAVALVLFSGMSNPVSFAASVLGGVPILFAALFLTIPAIRRIREKKENDRIKKENLRKDAYKKVWGRPEKVKSSDFTPSFPESRPDDLAAAQESVILELGAYAQPEVEIADDGSTNYSFSALAAEKKALETYRSTIDPEKYKLGATVFDSHN